VLKNVYFHALINLDHVLRLSGLFATPSTQHYEFHQFAVQLPFITLENSSST